MVLVLWAFVGTFYSLFAPQIVGGMKAFERLSRDEEQALDEIARRLESYYRQNAAAIDAAPSFGTAPEILWAQLGIEPKANLRLAVSERIASSQVRFRRFVVWLARSDPDTSRLDPVTGSFTAGPGVSFRIVDGEAIQNALLEETLSRMKTFAAQLERRFLAKFEADPLRSLDVNHFRAIGASCSAALDDIPCIDVHTDVVAAADFGTLLSSDPRQFTSAWGERFTVSNLEDSHTDSPPYSMAIRAPLPWGGSVLVNAVQPIN